MVGSEVPRFDRSFFASPDVASRIGAGEVGGKAEGLLHARDILASAFQDQSPGLTVRIPRFVVLATDVFDAFMERNELADIAASDDSDDRIAHAFQQAHLPSEVLGDLRAVTDEVHRPLAVRSSSLLEDALGRPFAGVYETKMIPNNQADGDTRFRRLVEAVKFVYASTFFSAARSYRKAIRVEEGAESMAVILQEVVGDRHGDRYYPHISAVARSYNYYPAGRARPEEGVASLALGLGKTIVDGGICWSYSPPHPNVRPPFGSTAQMMKETQSTFWAVNMGTPPYDPVAEAEYLLECTLDDAEYDGVLPQLASTYDADNDRLRPGTGTEGPRVLDFAPILQLRTFPFNDLIIRLLDVCESALDAEVEMELAARLPPGEGLHVGFLQVRPLVAPGEAVVVEDGDMSGDDVLLASSRALGNGEREDIVDIVYVKPETFESRFTPQIAEELSAWNRTLMDEGRRYALIGFGRWGSSDPWLGIPVSWGQVAGARVLVEAGLATMNVEPSQGSHFFHNLSSLGVFYLAVPHSQDPGVRWDLLAALPAVRETALLRHVRTSAPLAVRVDGRSGRGVVHLAPRAARAGDAPPGAER